MLTTGTLGRVVTSLRSTPLLSLAAVVCAAIGVAATTTTAALFSAVAVRPVPFPAADRLVRIWLVDTAGRDSRGSLSIPDLRDLDERVPSLDAFLGTARSRAVAIFDDGAERLRGEGVTPDYFQALGLAARHGRLLTDTDFMPAAPRVVVIGAQLWARRFGSDPHVVGRTLRTEGAVYTVVGVAPEGFAGTVESDVVEFWIPLPQYLPASLVESRAGRSAWAIGRLAPDATPAALEAELAALRDAWTEQWPDLYRDRRLRVEPVGENWRADFRTGATLLFGAVGLLLLIAALNVAGLLMARTLDRQHDIATRAALGATRATLVTDLVLDAIALTTIGGLVGALLAPALLDAVVAASPVALPPYLSVHVDGLALAVAVAGILGAGLLASLAPAWFASGIQPADVLRGAGRGAIGRGREHRWGVLLVGAEVALTLALLVTGSLLLRSFQALSAWNVGYRVDGVARLALTFSRADAPDETALVTAYAKVREALTGYPGVDAVGLVAPTLPPWTGEPARVRFAELTPEDAADGLQVAMHLADASLLPMLDVPLVAGRHLQESDDGAARVAVVSRALADRLGGPDAAVGRALDILPGSSVSPAPLRIVGVVDNVAYDGFLEQGAESGTPQLRTDPGWLQGRYDLYVPLLAAPQRVVSIGATTSGDAAALIEPLRRVLGRVAPTSAVHWTSTMADELAVETAGARFYSVLVNAYSLGALVLTASGVFAMLSHLVARRRSEIGLRMALGGDGRDIVRLIARLTAAPLALGIAAGWALATAGAAGAAGLLFGVGRFDVTSYAMGTGVMLLAGLVAAGVPTRRALRVDPMRTMRAE
ncbi:MAG: ABC transporter permease [Vicinamibacterales bacterium]